MYIDFFGLCFVHDSSFYSITFLVIDIIPVLFEDSKYTVKKGIIINFSFINF